MASPFPGMDPYIEDQRWEGFHNRLIIQIGDSLVAQLQPKYEVEPEERIYVETTTGDDREIRPDIAVSISARSVPGVTSSQAVLDLEPSVHSLPMPLPLEEREVYLALRKRGEREVVTVLELLSPSNKRPSSDGRREYLRKRHQVLRSDAHLVEIDLLLGGERLPTLRPLRATTDYCAFVCRAGQRPQAEVFEWSLRSRLPRIPIPLLPEDPDAVLNLQQCFDAVYNRTYYYTVDYSVPLNLPLKPADEAWMKQLFAARTIA